MTVINLLRKLFADEPALTDEDREVKEWAEAVRDSNWVRLHQMRFDKGLAPDRFFDYVALGYCYCFAAGVEPTREADWTAFKKTLENLHYPAMAEAITIRSQKGK
jgi:hypothetical protein